MLKCILAVLYQEMEEQITLEVSQDLDDASEGPPTTTRRAKSVPVHMLGNRSARHEVSEPN